MRRHDLQYEGRKKPDDHSNLRLATWNIGSMVGRGTEVAMELVKRKVSVLKAEKETCSISKGKLRDVSRKDECTLRGKR